MVGNSLTWVAPGAEHLLDKEQYKFVLKAAKLAEKIPGYLAEVDGQAASLVVSVDEVSEKEAALEDAVELQAYFYWPHGQFERLEVTQHHPSGFYSVKDDPNDYAHWLLFAADPSPLLRRDYSPMRNILGACYLDWPDDPPLCDVFFSRGLISYEFEVQEANWQFIPQLRDFAESTLLSWSVPNPE